MKRSVRILRRAQRDLEELDDFVRRESPSRAEALIHGLLDAIDSLDEMSERGASPRDETLRAAGYRFLLHQRYLVFYKIVGRQVRIYRVLHGSRAYRALL